MFKSIALPLVCLLIAQPVVANESVAKELSLLPNHIESMREGFADAERRASRATEYEFAALYEEFSDYPLWPYIESAYLQNNLSLDQEPLILSFLQQYYGSPAERAVREAWLNYLARRNDAERYTRDFVNRGSTREMCRYLGYRLQLTDDATELKDEIWPLVEQRWVQPSSQPRLCDPVFRQWTAAGQRTQDVVWQRFDQAVQASNWNMARYIRSLLDDEYEAGATQLANDIMSLRQRPARVANFAQFPADSERARDHVYAALQQMAWRDVGLVQRVWPQLRQHFDFTPAQVNVTESQVGVVLAVRNEPEARAWFEQIDLAALRPAGQHWYLATLLRERDFTAVLEFTELMDEGAQRQYWRARSLGELNRPVESEAEWRELAESRHYYGFMAAAQLDIEPNLTRERVTAEPQHTESLMNRPEVQRAFELRQLERYFDARREWNLARARITSDEQVAAALLMYDWGWLDQSIREFAALGLTQDLDRRFPLGFEAALRDQAGANDIDVAWAFAIIRRESAFQTDALSPAGARGLMQIMPDTAAHLERSGVGRNPRRPTDLNNPEDNIRLGTRYLADLLRRNDNNWLLATASYNAGYYRVQEWIPQAQVPVDIWIETIPYQETRDYVKAVLTYQQIYTNLLGRDDKLMQHMHSMLMNPDGGLCDDARTDAQPIAVC
ncbi:MAG: lytic transglycosylase domain-containing protein [Idiomarina sp.]|nr:lytic transglycosylase domain-containing protein [Idiomarina sp.]